MLDTRGHELTKVYGGKRESKHETIREHEARIIAGSGHREGEQDVKEHPKK